MTPQPNLYDVLRALVQRTPGLGVDERKAMLDAVEQARTAHVFGTTADLLPTTKKG